MQIYEKGEAIQFGEYCGGGVGGAFAPYLAGIKGFTV